MKIEPIGTKVIVHPSKVSKTMESGIVLTAMEDRGTRRGIVVYVGPGNKDYQMQVKEGDLVLYPSYAGQTTDIDGVEHITITEPELIGIVRYK